MARNKIKPSQITSAPELKLFAGLDAVDNTSDTNKPISTATLSALANKLDLIKNWNAGTNSPTLVAATPVADSTLFRVSAPGVQSITGISTQFLVDDLVLWNGFIWVRISTSSASATETSVGTARIATQVETNTGTDDTVFITPLKLETKINASTISQSIGDGVSTSYTVTHNFNTRNVMVEVYANSGNYGTVLCDVLRPTVNTISVNFDADSVPSLNQFIVIVRK